MHFHFSQNFLSSRKVAKKRKYLTFSKFTKSVNLLVLETQGSKTTAERIGPYEKKTQAASAKDFPPRWAADSSYATQP